MFAKGNSVPIHRVITVVLVSVHLFHFSVCLFFFFLFFFQALGVFGLCQIHAFVDYVRSKLTSEQFNLLFKSIVLLVGIVGTIAAAIATATGSIL